MILNPIFFIFFIIIFFDHKVVVFPDKENSYGLMIESIPYSRNPLRTSFT